MGQQFWSAPVTPLNIASSTPAVAAAATDLSPYHPTLPVGYLDIATRIRLRAYGELTCTSGVSGTEILSFYMNQVGTAFGTTPAILAASAGQTLAVGVAFPWMLEWEGQIRAITDTSPGAPNSGAAQIMGQGKVFWATSLTAYTTSPIPATAAGRTVAQTATGLVTNTVQYVAVVGTLSTTTDVTSVTCDELTCELLG